MKLRKLFLLNKAKRKAAVAAAEGASGSRRETLLDSKKKSKKNKKSKRRKRDDGSNNDGDKLVPCSQCGEMLPQKLHDRHYRRYHHHRAGSRRGDDNHNNKNKTKPKTEIKSPSNQKSTKMILQTGSYHQQKRLKRSHDEHEKNKHSLEDAVDEIILIEPLVEDKSSDNKNLSKSKKRKTKIINKKKTTHDNDNLVKKECSYNPNTNEYCQTVSTTTSGTNNNHSVTKVKHIVRESIAKPKKLKLKYELSDDYPFDEQLQQQQQMKNLVCQNPVSSYERDKNSNGGTIQQHNNGATTTTTTTTCHGGNTNWGLFSFIDTFCQ